MPRLRVHDATSVELALDVALEDRGVEVELWFFVPSQLAIDEPSFDRDAFYRDRTAYIRFEAPNRPLKDAATLLGAIEVDRVALAKGTASPTVEAGAIRALRLYGASVRDELRRRRREVEALPIAVRGAAVDALVTDSVAVLASYRALRASLARPSPSFAVALGALDDFLSMQALEVWFHIHERSPHLALANAIRQETVVRQREGHHGPLRADDAEGNEAFVAELNRLKKYVQSALHLRFVSTRRTAAAQDLAFGLAAALAMTVAVILQLVALWTVGTPGGPRDWASLSAFVAFAVGGYILKDRMKDHLKEWFAQRLPHWLYDRRVELTPEDRSAMLGAAEETVRLVPVTEVPAPILAMRNAGEDPIELAVRASDDVVHYRRTLRLNRTAGAQCPEADAIEQILRFNLAEWMRRMDDPFRDLYQLDDAGMAHRIRGPKTYRVPVLLMVTRGGRTERVREVLVLSRKKVVRVGDAPVAPDVEWGQALPFVNR